MNKSSPYAVIESVPEAYRPAYALTDPVHFPGEVEKKRRMVVLRTNGCEYDRDKKGCTMCGFMEHAIPDWRLRVREIHLVRQLLAALDPVISDPDLVQVDLLTLGSFFHDVEVDPGTRSSLLKTVAGIDQVRRVVVESRATYISARALESARGQIRTDQRLELGLGIETSNEGLRNFVLRKGLRWNDVERTMRLCRDNDVDFLAYLLIKPPSLTEREAAEDAVRSAEDVVSLAQQVGVAVRLAFEPVFVAHDSYLNTLFEREEYKVGRLWTVVEVLKKCHGIAPIFIGLSDEGLSSGRFPSGCAHCDGALRAALRTYNGSQDITALASMDCGCRHERDPQDLRTVKRFERNGSTRRVT